MRNHGLFSTLFIDKIRSEAKLDDAGQGRMATLGHTWKNCDKTDLKSLWNTYIKQALSYLSFVPPVSTELRRDICENLKIFTQAKHFKCGLI